MQIIHNATDVVKRRPLYDCFNKKLKYRLENRASAAGVSFHRKAPLMNLAFIFFYIHIYYFGIFSKPI